MRSSTCPLNNSRKKSIGDLSSMSGITPEVVVNSGGGVLLFLYNNTFFIFCFIMIFLVVMYFCIPEELV